MKYSKYSLVIVGSGIAGLYLALKVAKEKQLKDGILVITKSEIKECNSRFAQGGIVAVLPDINKGDSITSHISDTIKAGAGLNDFNVVKFISENSSSAINELMNIGVPFDKNESGNLSFGLEAAHSIPRILHAGFDATGKYIENTLCGEVLKSDEIEVYEHAMAVELLVDNQKDCKGILVYNSKTDSYEAIYSNAVVLATGGVGQLYQHTTNPSVATGDGVALSYLAGADISNMEFMQFHPTALSVKGKETMPLVSEAVRGEGATLVDDNFERFMREYNIKAELAPRDIVSRAVYDVMNKRNLENVYLDISMVGSTKFKQRFPSISKICEDNEIDIENNYIPVSPAAHFCMGGVKTNINGETSIKNLYAIGEVACNGFHGANRLASNSLLECVVCAHTLGESLGYKNLSAPKTIDDSVKNILDLYESQSYIDIYDFDELRNKLKKTMWDNAGIVRDEKMLNVALSDIERICSELKDARVFSNKEGYELRNSLIAAKLIVKSALQRKESIGAHYRMDIPVKNIVFVKQLKNADANILEIK